LHERGGDGFQSGGVANERQCLEEVCGQRLLGALDRLAQIIECHAAAAARQRQMQRPPHGTPVLAMALPAFVLLRSHALDQPMERRQRGIFGRSSHELQQRLRVARQPAIRCLFEIRDGIVGHGALPEKRCTHGGRGVVLQPIQHRTYRSSGQRRQ
jgi:hypothetical protein